MAAALVHKAVGDQLTCVYVDTGLMRANESEQVEETFRRQFRIDLVHVKAADRFFDALAGVSIPRRSERSSGSCSSASSRRWPATWSSRLRPDGPADPCRVARPRGDAAAGYLVQGTLYPDVIESGSDSAASIKSHHNVGGLPDDLAFDLVDPSASCSRTRCGRWVRNWACPLTSCGASPSRSRPGRAHRGRGHSRAGRILRAADAIVVEEIRRAGLYRDLWQSFAVLPAVRSVGVMGDGRTYAYPVIIRAVTSDDAMTADWARLPYDVLERLSSRIINEVEGVNRVALDITSKPPGTIEWE